MSTRPLAVAAVLLLAAATAPAADPTLAALKLGKPISGKVPTADDLKGKVVVVEHWGIN